MTIYRNINYERLDETLRQAVLYWAQLNSDRLTKFDDGTLEVLPSTLNDFVILAEKIYYSEIENLRWKDEDSYPDKDDPNYQGKIPISVVMVDPPEEGTPTTYIHYGSDGEVLYVGKTIRPSRRQSEHRKLAPWWDLVRRIEFTVHPDTETMSMEELRLIKELHPIRNVTNNRACDR